VNDGVWRCMGNPVVCAVCVCVCVRVCDGVCMCLDTLIACSPTSAL
jgi:hypothetical protein